jgi:hypothetical protein
MRESNITRDIIRYVSSQSFQSHQGIAFLVY